MSKWATEVGEKLWIAGSHYEVGERENLGGGGRRRIEMERTAWMLRKAI